MKVQNGAQNFAFVTVLCTMAGRAGVAQNVVQQFDRERRQYKEHAGRLQVQLIDIVSGASLVLKVLQKNMLGDSRCGSKTRPIDGSAGVLQTLAAEPVWFKRWFKMLFKRWSTRACWETRVRRSKTIAAEHL